MEQVSFKERNFVIAEVLACTSFILNTICVVTGKERHGPTAPVWSPDFGFVYWLKTTLALVGLFYFFTSRVFAAKKTPLYVSVTTMVTLWYSVPMVNAFLTLDLDALFSGLYTAHKQVVSFGSRIPTQIVWSIPMIIVAIDLLRRLIVSVKEKNKNV